MPTALLRVFIFIYFSFGTEWEDSEDSGEYIL